MAAVRPTTAFIGREPELERLRALLSAAAAGSSAAALIAGDAGVGKTSVVAEFGRRAQAAGALVLTGRNVDLGSGGLPYLPFSEALAQVMREDGPARDVVRQVAQLRPVLARLGGHGGRGERGETLPDERPPGDAGLDRLALFEAVAESLSQLAQTVAPVVLVIEDLHWAEQSTRDLLRFLLTRLGSDPLMFVITYRSDDLHRRHPVRALLAELVRLPSVELLELHPFDDAELSDFLAALHGERLPTQIVARIGERSAGNAYFAEELLSAGTGDRLPAALTDVLIDRLERLAPATQQLVRAASVIGAVRIEDALLRAAAVRGTGLTQDDADAGLRDAVAHQVLVPDDADRFGFRHALLQEAIYADLLPGERVRLHAAVARLLAERDTSDTSPNSQDGDGDAAEQARHSLAAHDLPQALGAALRAAAAASRRLAPAEALAQYEVALQLWPVVDPARRPASAHLVPITLAAADVAGDAGLPDRAVALSEAAVGAAVDTGDEAEAMRARSRLAIHLFASDRMHDVIRLAREVIAGHPGTADGGACGQPTAALVWARAILGRALFSVGDPSALDVVPPGLIEARALGLRAAEADLEMTWSSAAGMLGQPEADVHLALAREAAEASGDHNIALRVAYGALVDRFEEGDLDGVISLISDTLAVAERAGLSTSLYATQSRWMLVNAHWMRGAPQDALDVVTTGLLELPPAGARQLEHAALQILAARSPQRCLDWALGLDRVHTNPWDAPSRWAAKAEAWAWLGDLEQSAACSRTAIEAMEALGEPHLLAGIAISTNAVAVLADLAAQARSAGDGEAAQAAIDAAGFFLHDARERARLGRPRRFRMGPEGRAWLVRLDAEELRLLGPDAADDDRLRRSWEATVEAFGFGAVYEQARCRWRLAQVLLAIGDRDAARAQVTQAREVAAALGAEPLLAALDDLARRGRLDPAASATAGGRLTTRERDVMRLVAQGLTNRAVGERLFISEKTASVHVSNVLTKLGASGRTEAVAIATRDGLL